MTRQKATSVITADFQFAYVRIQFPGSWRLLLGQTEFAAARFAAGDANLGVLRAACRSGDSKRTFDAFYTTSLLPQEQGVRLKVVNRPLAAEPGCIAATPDARRSDVLSLPMRPQPVGKE